MNNKSSWEHLSIPKLATLVLFVSAGSLSSAAPYEVGSIGTWNSDDTTTLAGALNQSDSVDNGIQLSADLNSGTWAGWQTSGSSGAILFQPNYELNSTLSIDLNGFVLGGSDLSFVSGENGILSFGNGTLGTGTETLYFGGDGHSNVVFDDTSILAQDIVFLSTDTYFANVTFTNSTIVLNNGQFSMDGEGDTPSDENYYQTVLFDNTTLEGVDTLTITNGAALRLSNNSSIEVNTIIVDGAGTNYNSSLSGQGSLTWYADMTISGGANVDLTNIAVNGDAAGSLTVGKFGTTQRLEVTGGKTVGELSEFTGSSLTLNGFLSILNGSYVLVRDAALITGITNLTIDGANSKMKLTGELAYDPDTRNYLTSGISITGNLQISNNGVLAIENGWALTLQTPGSSIEVTSGGTIYMGEDLARDPGEDQGLGIQLGLRSELYADYLYIDTGSLYIRGGAAVDIAQDAILGRASGSTTLLSLDDPAVGAVNGGNSLLTVGNNLVIGQDGNVTVNVRGTAQVTAGSTLLAANAGSTANIYINTAGASGGIQNFYSPSGAAWNITGNGETSLDALTSYGSASLQVESGLIFINEGIFSMGAQDATAAGYDSGTAGSYGVAYFTGGNTELRLHNGTFSNQGAGSTGSNIGKIIFTSGAILSGEGNMIAGESIRFDGAVISPGSRYLYDDLGVEGNHPLVVGILDLTINSPGGSVVITGSTHMRIDFSEDGSQGDKIIVHGGNTTIDEGLIIDLDRLVKNTYVILEVDGGTIDGSYAGYSLDQNPQYFTLNGKELYRDQVNQSERVFIQGGNIISSVQGNQLLLTVDSGGGNVITKWTGATGTTWNMFERDWESSSTFNTSQFLDGDSVTFDDTASGASIDIDTEGVVVSEINITGNNNWQFSQGGITTYNSELYTTLIDPSGRLNKVGSGTTTFSNANEFYGGVYMGSNGTTGGTIILDNERGLGTYNLSNITRGEGKGTVYVREDSTVETTGNVNAIQNRFIVEAGKTLTLNITNSILTVQNDRAAGNGYKDNVGGSFWVEGTVIASSGLVLSNNSARQGGSLHLRDDGTIIAPSLTVENSFATISVSESQNNSGFYAGGGGIHSSGTRTLGENLIVQNNSSLGNGGGIFVSGYSGGGDGTLALSGNTSILNNNSFGTGGGILVDGTGYNGKGKGTLVLNAETGNITFQGNLDNVDFDDGGQNAINPPAVYNISNSSAVYLAGGTLNVTGSQYVYFYDPVSGSAQSTVTIGSNTTDTVTAVFHGSSLFEGTTTVDGESTFRLENGTTYVRGQQVYGDATGAVAYATYGITPLYDDVDNTSTPATDSIRILDSSNWQTDWTAIAQSFVLNQSATITGQGYIGATNISLNGILNLDDGDSTVNTTSMGTLGLIGAVSVSDTSAWYLNLSHPTVPGELGTTDLIRVAGAVTFTGSDISHLHDLYLDDTVHGKYLVMETTGGISSNYNTNVTKSSAHVWWNGLNLTETGLFGGDIPGSPEERLGRIRAVTYAEDNNLYLDVTIRNRHVLANEDNGIWRDDNMWEFSDSTGTPLPDGGNLTTDWAALDRGSFTNVYINGDMVTFNPPTGDQSYDIQGTVTPVDVYVRGNSTVTWTGTGNIRTLSPTDETDIDLTTINPIGDADTNDYGIPYYTGRLIKTEGNRLVINNASNMFTAGISVGTENNTNNAGIIEFGSANQLTVGDGQYMIFHADGTLNYSAASAAVAGNNTTTFNTDIQVLEDRTATFDIETGLNLRQGTEISGAGSVVKLGSGTWTLAHSHSFTGGMTIGSLNTSDAGTVVIAASNSLGAQYNGLVTVLDSAVLTTDNSNRTIRNRIDVRTGGALTITTVSGRTLTNRSVDTSSSTTPGGAVNVYSDADAQIVINGAGTLALENNTAYAGAGGLYTENTDDLVINSNVKFDSNTLSANGGFGAGALYALANVTLNGNVVFTNNKNLSSAGTGGAIYSSGTVTLTGEATVTGNSSVTDGGAIYANSIDYTNTGTATAVFTGNSATGNGGAFYVNGGTLSLNATSGSIQISGNTAANGSGAYIAGDSSSVIADGPYDVYFYDTVASNTSLHTFIKSGSGTLMFANENGEQNNSAFYGNTTVNEGNFRITQNTIFGVNSAGTTFDLAGDSFLTGGGTIGAENSILSGILSADTDSGLRKESAAAEHNYFNIGTLSFDGNVALDSSRIIVDMQTNPSAPLNDLTAIGSADLINITGSLSVDSTATFDLYSFGFGQYLVIDSGNTIQTSMDNFTATVHSEGLTDRHQVNFYRGDDAAITNGDNTQVWIATVRNSLYMIWDGEYSGTWNAYDTNTLSNQNWTNYNVGRSDTAEGHVENYDTVVFRDNGWDYDTNTSDGATVTNSTINIVASQDAGASAQERAGTIVSAMIVDNDSVNYTFTGAGISTNAIFEGTILTLDPADYTVNNAPQSLTKSGTGTLTFANTSNRFGGAFLMYGGIVNLENNFNSFLGGIIFDGTVSDARQINFTTAGQIGSQSITFNQEGTLHVLGSSELTNVITTNSNAIFDIDPDVLVTLTFRSDLTGSGNVTKNGMGTLEIANMAFNAISGDTLVNTGTFRISGAVYGTAADNTFQMTSNTHLEGGGTLNAGRFSLAGDNSGNVVISPDGKVISATRSTNFIGTLSFAATSSLTFQNFTYEYDMGTAAADKLGSTATGDLLNITSGTLILNGANNILDLYGPELAYGDNYLLIDSSTNITSDGTTIVTPGNVFSLITKEGQYVEPRVGFAVTFGDLNAAGDGLDTTQLWLGISRNTLDMVWSATSGGAWNETDSNWTSTQVNNGVHSTVFNDGDFVHFNGGSTQTVTLADNVIVSGFVADNQGTFTFGGPGGIQGLISDPSITGQYIEDASIIPDGRLLKTGVGTVVFNNGANNFAGGIWLNQGLLSINNANQIGDVAQNGTDRLGIHFIGNSTLQSNADSLTLDHAVYLTDGIQGNLDTPNTFIISGLISETGTAGGGGILGKTGSGTVILTAVSAYTGGTSVEEGILEITGNASTAGASGTTVMIASGATFRVGVQPGNSYILNNVIEDYASGNTGTLAINSGGISFAFGADVAQATSQGAGFTGNTEIYGVTYNIDAITEGFFRGGATLVTKEGSNGFVTPSQAADKAWDLRTAEVRFDGGRMTWQFGADNENEGIFAAANITTGTNQTEIALNLDKELETPDVDINNGESLFSFQEPVIGDTLLLATSQTDLSSLNTSLLPLYLYIEGEQQPNNETDQIIVQNNVEVADGYFDWGTYSTSNNELRVGYKLVRIEVYEGETLAVVREDNDQKGFYVYITDKTTNGSVIFQDNSNAGDGILLGSQNTYTGKTTIGTDTELTTTIDYALGNADAHTNELDLTASNSRVNLGDTTQYVGKLTIGTPSNTLTGILDMGTGILTVDNGGTVYGDGALTGGDTLNLSSGTLTVTGSNGGVTANVNNAASSTVILNEVDGLGATGDFVNDGTLNLQGATGDFQKNLSSSGSVLVTNNADVSLQGDNSSYSGVFNIESGSTLSAGQQSHIGTADVVLEGTFVVDNSTDWVLDQQNNLSGSGTLRKEGSGELAITHANPGLTGTTIINGGSIKVTTNNALGSTAITNDALLELAPGVTQFANNMSGNGETLVSGSGITISGNNSGYTVNGLWHITGSALVTSQNNLGQAGVFLDGTSSQLSLSTGTPGSYDFINELTGNGKLSVKLTGYGDNFTFNTSAGTGFTGTLQLEDSHFELGGTTAGNTNAAAMQNAFLQGSAGSKTNILANVTIGGWIIDGGRTDFLVDIPPDEQALGVLTATNGIFITENAGQIAVSSDIQAGFENPKLPTERNLLDQDNIGEDGIKLANGYVTGSVGSLELIDENGHQLSDPENVDIFENGVWAAIGTYDFGLTTDENREGLYVDYILKVLDLKATGDNALTLDNATARDNHLDARVTGYGNLAIEAHGGEIILNNGQNDYTGETIIKSGTLTAGVSNALGSATSHTGKLIIYSGATFNLNNNTQTIGALDNQSGTILIGSGTLTTVGDAVSNGGRIDLGTGEWKVNAGGTINGNDVLYGSADSLLHVDPSILYINGANTNFHGDTLIEQGSSVILGHTYGLGDGTVTLAGTDDSLKFNITDAANAGPSQAFENNIVGPGVLEVINTVPGGSVYINRANNDFTGTTRVDNGELVVTNLKGVGTSLIDAAGSDGRFTWLNVEGEITNEMTGPGTIGISNSTVSIARDNSAGSFDINTGSYVTMENTAALGTPFSTVRVDNTSTVVMGVEAVLGNVVNNGLIAFNTPPAESGSFMHSTMTSLSGNGNLLFNVNFATLESDFLTIRDSASPTQTVIVNRLGGIPESGNNSIPIIETVNFVSSPDAFRLLAGADGRERVEVGSYSYTLRQGNGTPLLPDQNEWYLVGDSLSKVAQSIIGSAAGIGLAWHLEMDTLGKRMGDLRLSQKYGTNLTHKDGGEVWARAYGFQLDAGSRIAGIDYREYYYGGDIGADWLSRYSNSYSSGAFYKGVFMGGGRSDRRFDGFGSGDTDMYRGGVYLTWVEDSGWYADLVAKGNYYEHKFDSISSYLDRSHGKYDQWGLGASLEIGKQFIAKSGFVVEPQVQFSYGHLSGKNYETTGDIPMGVRLESQDSFRLRGGVRAGQSFDIDCAVVMPYAKVNGYGFWTDGGWIHTSDGLERKATMDGAAIGVGGGVIWETKGCGQIYVDYEYTHARKYTIPWEVNIGYRIQW